MTEINSQVLTQSEKPVDFNTTKTQEGLLSKIFSLINKNPNYKMLGALGMMLVNFSVCVTIANWLKHSARLLKKIESTDDKNIHCPRIERYDL